MSELQISLLVIGFLVVLVMYGYGWWQQRQYRRRFGATFSSSRQDALYSSAAQSDAGAADAPTAELEDEAGLQSLDQDVPRHAPAVAQPEEECELQDDTIDFIAVLTLPVPAHAGALLPLWQRRFDFGKNVNACGLNAISGEWEKLHADSPSTYSAFRLGLQLADRSGPVSEVALSEFRDLVDSMALKLEAGTELPKVAVTVARAMQLDGFCAEVDQMIGLNILPGGERLFSGSEVEHMTRQFDMALQADGSFHLHDASGNTVFSLSHFDGTPFQFHTLDKMRITGLTLLLDVPRIERPAQRFDEMAVLARKIAMDLRAAVMDDHRVALGEPGIAQIRELVGVIESRMLNNKVVPGSAQARRLFS